MRPSQVFRALSDPTRLRILHLLRGGELCVCDLMTILRVPQPTASRHLGYLRRAGLVRVREKGPWAFYSLAPRDGLFHRRVLACLDGVPQPDRDRRRALRRRGSCCP